MLIDALIEVLSPPTTPLEGGTTAAWGAIHGRLGAVLPEDYIQFIRRYGTGTIGGWLSVLNPFAASQHQNLLVAGFEFLAAMRELKSEFPEAVPFPLYYEPGGLLPWGSSIDGDTFCWRTNGMSGRWTVVIIGRHTDPEAFDLPFSTFVRGILMNTVQTAACPPDLPRTFESGAAGDSAAV